MTIRANYLAAAAAIGALAAPAAAQNAYPYGYQQQAPQPYAGQQGYGYGQPGYNQGGVQDPVSQIINSLLGNRYNVTDRQAVSRCASAALTQAQAQYGNRYNQGYGNNGYANNGNNGYANNGYNRGYNNAMRVTSITDVQRRHNGLRVTGLMSSGTGGQWGNHQYNDQNRAYGQDNGRGDISFRCKVDYRGQVSDIRLNRNNGYRG